MQKDDSILEDRLSTLRGESPRMIRENLVEAIREAIPSHFAMFFRVAEDPGGEMVFTDELFRGDEESQSELSQMVGAPCRELRTPWMPGEIDRGEIDSFIRTRHFYDDEELFSYEAQRKLLRPLEVGEHLRATFYDGATFLGWIGLIRRGEGERFSAAEERKLEEMAGRMKAAIATSNALQADLLGDQASAVFDADGRLAHATEAFVEWMTPALREYLQRRVAGAEQGDLEPAVEILAGAEIRLSRMDGPDGVRYLATFDPARPARLTVTDKLTDRQVDVAGYVAAGATSKKVAETLEISANTVHYHLRNIYDRLGIGSRAELARLMAEEDIGGRDSFS